MSKVFLDLMNISRLLASFSDHVRNDNAMGSFFINSIAEDISKPILKILFDCHDLQNLNYVTSRNYPAIDLGDNKKRISFQITSDGSLDKVKDTLKKFVSLKNKQHEIYDELYFYIIKGNKESSYKSKKIEEILLGTNFNFDVNQHILDNSDILKLIRERLIDYPDKIKEIFDLLSKHYGDITSKLVPVNIETTNLIFSPPSFNITENNTLQIFPGFENIKSQDYYSLGNKMLHEKKYQESIDNFDKAIDILNQNMAQVLADKGVNYCYQGDFASGIDELEKAIKLNPNHPKIRANLGFSYYSIKDYQKAIYELEISFKLEQDMITKEILLMSYYEEAIILKDESKYQESLDIFKKMNGIYPDDENTLVNIGGLNTLLKNYDAAEKYLKQVLDKNKNNIQAKLNLASTYSKIDIDKSIKLYRELLETAPELKQLNYNLGVTYDKLGDYDNAIKYLQRELEIDPNFSIVYKDLGNISYRKEDYENATLYYEKYLIANKLDHIIYSNLAQCYYKINKTQEAIDNYTKAITLDTNNSKYYFNLGLIYKTINNKRAVEEFKKALDIDPNYDKALYNLSRLYSLLKKKKKALENLEKVINLDSRYKKIAKDDKDFEELKNDKTFKKLIS